MRKLDKSFQKGTVLVVDDERSLLEVMELSLCWVADRVIVADNGASALELLDCEEIHCVVCDIQMPGMDGIEVVRRLRKTHPQMPVILFTGHGNMELMKEAALLGVMDFIDKPKFSFLEEVVHMGLQVGIGKELAETIEDKMSAYKKLLFQIEEH